MREDYSEIGHYFLYLGVDANRYYRALNDAWEALQREYGKLALPGFPDREYFVMTVYPERFGLSDSVRFTLCDDARQKLIKDAEYVKQLDLETEPSQLPIDTDAEHEERPQESLPTSKDAVTVE